MPIIAYLPRDMNSGANLIIRQGFSKVEDPGQGLVGMRGEAPQLASNVGDVMQIHQREHHRVEYRQHLSHRREAHAAIILP